MPTACPTRRSASRTPNTSASRPPASDRSSSGPSGPSHGRVPPYLRHADRLRAAATCHEHIRSAATTVPSRPARFRFHHPRLRRPARSASSTSAADEVPITIGPPGLAVPVVTLTAPTQRTRWRRCAQWLRFESTAHRPHQQCHGTRSRSPVRPACWRAGFRPSESLQVEMTSYADIRRKIGRVRASKDSDDRTNNRAGSRRGAGGVCRCGPARSGRHPGDASYP